MEQHKHLPYGFRQPYNDGKRKEGTQRAKEFLLSNGSITNHRVRSLGNVNNAADVIQHLRKTHGLDIYCEKKRIKATGKYNTRYVLNKPR